MREQLSNFGFMTFAIAFFICTIWGWVLVIKFGVFSLVASIMFPPIATFIGAVDIIVSISHALTG